MKRKGRPRMEDTLPENWKDIIIQAGIEGKHITDFLVKLNISWEGYSSLLKRNAQFRRTVEEYRKHAEEFWFNMAHQSMIENGGHRFNDRLWSLIMRNKFGDNWKENKNVDITTQGDKLTKPDAIKIEVIKKEVKNDD